MHVYRWDLDKTYLDTDIDSFRGLLRAAVQKANEKRNVPGSAALVRALQEHDPTAKIFVLSGSPTQMRTVLEQKLALDGIQVDQLILKDNLGNLRRGRLRAVRDQLGYKLPQLLVARLTTPAQATETLFGDDSEVDALVYAAYAAILDGELDLAGLERILHIGKVYPDAAQTALDAAGRLQNTGHVEDIFIRIERGVSLNRFAKLGGRVTPIFSWLQAALALEGRGRLSTQRTVEVVRSCVEDGAHSPGALAGLFQDAVRRRMVSEEAARGVLDRPGMETSRDTVNRALDRLNGVLTRPLAESAPDWAGFFNG